ncbi:MAG: hypothetical protein P9X22_09260 [Candidatus Zapsychrus exili]|nr:hypothetical protein [Candidatus Zapsychrus exili]
MGVIYKFKQEVIDFILSQKKENSVLSCRKLADIVSKKFSLVVSKSSINTILKKAQLSSSVGRRATKSEKGFKIPEAKKMQIQENLRQVGLDLSGKDQKDEKMVQSSALESDQVKILDSERLAASIESLIQEPSEESQESVISHQPEPELDNDLEAKEEFISLQKDIFEQDIEKVESHQEKEVIEEIDEDVDIGDVERKYNDFLDYVGHLRSQKKSLSFLSRFEGMGAIFLKILQWEFDSEAFFRDFLKNKINGVLLDGFEKVCDAFLCFKLLGIDGLEHIDKYKHYALPVLGDYGEEFSRLIENKEDLENVLVNFSDDKFLQNIKGEYVREKEQLFLKVRGFKIIFEDAESLFIDAGLKSFYKNIPPERLACSFKKSFSCLSRSFVSNNYPAVFYHIDDETQELVSLVNIVDILENLSLKVIKEIEMLGLDGENLSTFSIIPNIKRKIIFGLNASCQAVKIQLQQLDSSLTKPFYHEQADKIYYYCEDTIISSEDKNGKQTDLKLIALCSDKTKDFELVIVTNMVSSVAFDIISAYFDRIPYLPSSFSVCDAIDCDNAFDNVDVLSVLDVINDLKSVFDNCFQRYLFGAGISSDNVSDFKAKLYELPGYLQKDNELLKVILDASEDFPYFKELQNIVKVVNSQNILDKENRKIFIEIAPS